MAIIATVGDPTSNSYVTRAEFDAYFASRLDHAPWDGASDAEIERAILQAGLDIDGIDFIGDPATTTQAMKWPRIDDDIFPDVSDSFDDDEIPQKLKYAQIEQAAFLLEGFQSGVSSSSSSQPVSSLKIGSSVEVKYDTSGGTVSTTVDSSGIGSNASKFLRGLRIPVIAV